jgi:hypothetical protein
MVNPMIPLQNNQILCTVNSVTRPYSTVNDWVKELDIAEGLKQLLIDADATMESIIDLGY